MCVCAFVCVCVYLWWWAAPSARLFASSHLVSQRTCSYWLGTEQPSSASSSGDLAPPSPSCTLPGVVSVSAQWRSAPPAASAAPLHKSSTPPPPWLAAAQRENKQTDQWQAQSVSILWSQIFVRTCGCSEHVHSFMPCVRSFTSYVFLYFTHISRQQSVCVCVCVCVLHSLLSVGATMQ